VRDSTKTIDGRSHRVEVRRKGDSLAVRVEGQLNEESNLSPTLDAVEEALPGCKLIDFDLSGITQLNSCGVRDWLTFLGRVQGMGVPYRFSSVNELFVDQASFIPTMLGAPGTPVLELELPYRCEKCGKRVSRAFSADEVAPAGRKPAAPRARCGDCGSEMAFDALEDEYFSVLRRPGS
jgi:DNA-directed RNA polymerase subunit RPC12/RpoP/ABC-type transporter Mla MlaB component